MENNSPTSQTEYPAGGVTITGDVNLDQGDFVDRDKNVRSIVTGRDVIGSLLITGDHNQVFVGDYVRLQDAYINPQSVFDRVNLEHFIGRDWLLAKVDDFLQDNDRGYFVIEASAGLGKTAFMAWLVKQRSYIHHFCELRPGLEGIGDSLKSLAAQLVRAYLEPKTVVPSAASRPDYFYNLLTQAANRRHTDEKIVIVVDALDEAGTPDNQNVLGLPTGLPEGVFFVVSQRPASVILTVKDAKTPRPYFSFSADDDKNKADMQRFLTYISKLPEIVNALQTNQHKYTSEEFITSLMEKSGGVWIYIYYMLEEIQRGNRSSLDLAALPVGLTQYYVHYWRRWRDADEEVWDEVFLPLLTTLAAAQESLSCQRLIEWSGAKLTERSLRRLLEREWRPFLTIAKQGTVSRYRFYHATLQEFFDGQIEQDNLSLDEIAFVNELSEETRMCHHRLADRYLNAWGGWTEELNRLKDEHLRDIDDRYGLRHLVTHLASSDRGSELWTLLTATPDWLTAQWHYDPSRRQYAWDLERAIEYNMNAEAKNIPQILVYNLLYAAAVSQVTNVPPVALALMTYLGQLKDALKFAELTASPQQQVEGYIEIAEILLSQGNEDRCIEVVELALSTSALIPKPGDRGNMLSKVASVFALVGKEETARSVLSDALMSINSERHDIGEAVINIAKTAISIDDADILTSLLPVALQNLEGGSISRGQFYSHFAVILGKGGRRNELAQFLNLHPLLNITESKAFTLAWIAFAMTLAGDVETANGLLNEVQLMVTDNGSTFEHQIADNRLEVAVLAAKLLLGERIDPLEVLVKARDVYDHEKHKSLDQYVLHEVLKTLDSRDELQQMRELIELPALFDFRIEILCFYAEANMRRGKPDDAEKAIGMALQAIDDYTERYSADWPNRMQRIHLVVGKITQLGCQQYLYDALDIAHRTQALNLRLDSYLRADGLAAVALAIARSGNKHKAKEILTDVLNLPEPTNPTVSEVRAWSEIVHELAGSADVKLLTQVAQIVMDGAKAIGDCNYIGDNLVTLAQGLAKIQAKESLAGLLSCVKEIKTGDFSRGDILVGIARAMARVGDNQGLREVITTAANICKYASPYCTDDASFEALVGIAQVLTKVADVDGLMFVVSAAEGVCQESSCAGFANVITTVALALIKNGEYEKTSSILSYVNWKHILSSEHCQSSYRLCVYNMAQIIAIDGQLERALAYVEYIEDFRDTELDSEATPAYLSARNDRPSRDESYIGVAMAWVLHSNIHSNYDQNFQIVIEIIRKIESRTNQFYGLIALALSLVELDKHSLVPKVIDEALIIIKTFEEPEKQARCMIKVAKTLLQLSQTNLVYEVLVQAAYFINQIADRQTKISSLGLWAQTCIQAKYTDQARTSIVDMLDILDKWDFIQYKPEIYINCLINIAGLCAQMDEAELADKCFSSALIGTERSQVKLWKTYCLTKWSRFYFQQGNLEMAQTTLSAALRSFTNDQSDSITSYVGRISLKRVVNVLVENGDRCSLKTKLSMFFNMLRFARNRGSEEILECIAIFSPIFSQLDIATEILEHMLFVEWNMINKKNGT